MRLIGMSIYLLAIVTSFVVRLGTSVIRSGCSPLFHLITQPCSDLRSVNRLLPKASYPGRPIGDIVDMAFLRLRLSGDKVLKIKSDAMTGRRIEMSSVNDFTDIIEGLVIAVYYDDVLVLGERKLVRRFKSIMQAIAVLCGSVEWPMRQHFYCHTR
mmetsp:Transcript_15282/g.15099  ORF Transcript_15282/g.15099 Transcript_15282/m.15099 type:complete len:156 (+) Transcript_15282:98-565(+)